MRKPNFKSIRSAIQTFLIFLLIFHSAAAHSQALGVIVDVSENECGYNVGCTSDNGWINLTILDGVEPLTFDWTGPDGYTADTEDIYFLAAGEYCVTVTDAVGSVFQACETLISDDVPPEWDFNCEYELEINACPYEATISISEGDEISIYDVWTVAGQPVPGLDLCVMDDCTKGTDLVILVSAIITENTGCEIMITVLFDAVDECGNVAEEFVLTYLVADTEAPEWNADCNTDTEFEGCPSGASINLEIGDEIDIFTGWTVGENAAGPLAGCISDNCTLPEDLIIRVIGKTEQDNGCSAEASITFEAEDECGNISDPFICNYIITDNESPVPPVIADIEITCILDIAPAEFDTLVAIDACQGPIEAVAADADNGGTGCGNDPMIITRTWTWDDGCGNAATATQTITVLAPPVSTNPDTPEICSCPEPEECEPCDGGTVLLELLYNGMSSADVMIRDGGSVYYDGPVHPGDVITLVPLSGDFKLKNNLDFYVNGSFQGDVHTSCSEPLGPGMTVGDFLITRAESRNNGPMCPVENDPGGEDETDCDCAGGTNRLDVRYNGSTDIDLVVRDGGSVYFDGPVQAGDTIILVPLDGDSRLKNNLDFIVDGSEAAYVHTSCSVPIYVGQVFGAFEITWGSSRNNGPFCDAGDPNPGNPSGPDDPDDPNDPDNPADCFECDGDLIAFEFEYNGPAAFLEIKDNSNHLVYFEGNVEPGGVIRIGDTWGLDKHLRVYIDGDQDEKIHAHCSGGGSIPLGPGQTIGYLTVVHSMSEAGPICPIENDDNSNDACGECDGDLTAFTFQYNGEDAFVEIKNNNRSVTYFSGDLATGESFSIDGSLTGGELDRHLKVYIDGHQDEKIHAHCSGGGSVPLGPGQVIGYLEVLYSESSAGGPICPIEESSDPIAPVQAQPTVEQAETEQDYALSNAGPVAVDQSMAISDNGQVISSGTKIKTSAYPNPFFERVAIEFSVPADASTTIEIYNVSGELIDSEDYGWLQAGMKQTFEFTPLYSAAGGSYIYRVISGNQIATGKLFFIR